MAERPVAAALVLAAGRGERFGGAVPKAFVELAGQTLLERSVRALAASRCFEHIVPVIADRDRVAYSAVEGRMSDVSGLLAAVTGGAERQDSMRAGLASLPPSIGLVAVHDAARCLVDPSDVARVVEVAGAMGAAILAEPVRDTVKRVVEGQIVETLDRAALWGAQTPQVFRRDWLEAATDSATRTERRATDDAALVEAAGYKVKVVESRFPNPKLTRPEDLAFARVLLAPWSGPAGIRSGV